MQWLWKMLSRKYGLNSFNVTDKPRFEAEHQGPLTEARLYVGDSDIEIHSFDHPLGSLAVAVVCL